MPLQTLPSSAEAYGRQQSREIAAAVAAVRRRWRRMGNDFDSSWATVGPRVQEVLDEAQRRAIEQASAYMPAVLAETRRTVRDAEYELIPESLIGTAGDGLATSTMAYGAVVHTKQRVAAGATPAAAREAGGRWLAKATGTLISDTGRTAEKMAGNARHVSTYVRMLNPPSCGRCVILAGRVTSSRTAFERHPGCDCRNIPSSEAVRDAVVDPRDYLDSLPSADELAERYPDLTVAQRHERGLVSLEDALGSRANAQAYRDGADLNQLVNAYRRKGSVQKAQQYGRTVKFTHEGTTRRGQANWAMQRWSRGPVDARGRRVVTQRRLMPESIYATATDRADAQRLLRMYGWI